MPAAGTGAFTLLELLTVIVIVGILATMLVPVFHGVLGRADLQSCIGNLKGLYVAANSYVQDQGGWPQIPAKDIQSPSYARAWNQAFAPYGIAKQNWICPAVQRALRNPDYVESSNARVDYLASVFGEGARTPYKWPTHPWFVERGDVHGDGQMVIFTNAEVKSLKEIFRHPVRTTVDSFP